MQRLRQAKNDQDCVCADVGRREGRSDWLKTEQVKVKSDDHSSMWVKKLSAKLA